MPKRRPYWQKSNTKLSTEALEARGYEVAPCEMVIPHTNIKRDLFGMFDLIAMKEGDPIIGVQCTSVGNVNARLKKIRSNPKHVTWLHVGTGAEIEVHGWEYAKAYAKGEPREPRYVERHIKRGWWDDWVR